MPASATDKPIRVTIATDPILRRRPKLRTVRGPKPLGQLVPWDPRYRVYHNGQRILNVEGSGRMVMPGDHVQAMCIAADGAQGVKLGAGLIGLGIAAFAGGKARKLEGKDAALFDQEPSPQYNLNGIRTTVENGAPQPYVVGETAVGGNIIHSVLADDGSGGNQAASYSYSFGAPVQHTLVMLGSGVFETIGGITASADRVPASAFDKQSVFLGDNAIENFTASTFSVRHGARFQDPIPGFDDIIHVQRLDHETELNTPTVFTTVTNVHGFAFACTLQEGRYYQDGSNPPLAQSIDLVIKWRFPGESTWRETDTFSHQFLQTNPFILIIRKDFTQSKYSQPSQVPIPAGAKVEVSIERTYPHRGDIPKITNPNPLLRNAYGKLIVKDLHELSDDLALMYSYRALLGIHSPATNEVSGTVRVRVKCRAKKMWTRDPLAANPNVYQFSASPADFFRDVILNKRCGMGDRNTVENIDEASFDDLRTTAVDQIAEAKPGFPLINRWEFAGVFDRRQRFGDMLDEAAGYCRAKILRIGNRYRAKVIKDGPSTQPFNASNMRNVTHSDYGSPSDPNTFVVQFIDEDQDYTPSTVVVPDEDLIAANGGIRNAKKIACKLFTNRTRVWEWARWKLNLIKYGKHRLAWESPLDAVTSEWGDIVDVTHPILEEPWGTRGGVVPSNASGSFKIVLSETESITIGAGETWKVRVRTDATGQDVYQDRIISDGPGTYAAGHNFTITVNWDVGDLPKKGDRWVAGPDTGDGHPTRRWLIQEKEFDVLNAYVVLEAINWDPRYLDTSPPDVLQPPAAPRQLSDDRVPDPVTSLRARQVNIPSPGGARLGVQISYNFPAWPKPHKVRIFGRVVDGDKLGTPLPTTFFELVETGASSYLVDLRLPADATYEFAVASVSPSGQYSRAPVLSPKRTFRFGAGTPQIGKVRGL